MPTLPSTPTDLFYTQEKESDRFLPEGPRDIRFEGRDAVAWVNIQTAESATNGAVHLRFWDTGEHRCFPQAKRPGFLFSTDRENTLFVGREKELGLLDLQTGAWEVLGTIPDQHVRTIINDGEIVPGGKAVVLGTKDLRFEQNIAHLYLFTWEDKKISVLADKQMCSNGKVFAQESDSLILFDIDTPRRGVTRYRLDLHSRTVSNASMAIDLKGEPGFPDGMIDVGDGTVIIAFYNPTSTGSGRAVRYRLATGEPLEEWTTPGSPRVTCPLLVENQGKIQLILTTAAEGMPSEMRKRCPNAGNLFIGATTLKQIPSEEVMRVNG